jgi:AcrR family transcriptional regulator
MTKGQDTHASLVDAAISFASEEGLAGITIGKLADKVGMSKSGLFAHFSSKENLQVEVLKGAIDRFVVMVVSPALKAPRGEPRVTALFERWLAWKDMLPGATAARIAKKEVHFRRDLDVDQFAHEFYCLGLGQFHVSRLLRDPKSDRRARSAFDRLIRDARHHAS